MYIFCCGVQTSLSYCGKGQGYCVTVGVGWRSTFDFVNLTFSATRRPGLCHGEEGLSIWLCIWALKEARHVNLSLPRTLPLQSNIAVANTVICMTLPGVEIACWWKEYWTESSTRYGVLLSLSFAWLSPKVGNIACVSRFTARYYKRQYPLTCTNFSSPRTL